MLHAINSDQKHTSCSGQVANAFLCLLQNFGMRVFQLTAPQPVDEVLQCLGDALSADQSKLPVIMGCSRLRNQDGGVSATNFFLKGPKFRGLAYLRSLLAMSGLWVHTDNARTE